jgi:DNA-directed RNA polymerase alpha subunit
MTQRNIEMMDIIVTKMTNGASLSKALESVYVKRTVRIPYREEYCEKLVADLGLSRRAFNALMRSKLKTIGDIIEFCNEKKITDVSGLGTGSGVEVFEAILDYCWGSMSQDEKTVFLIDTVERNSDYIRAEIEL